MIAGRGESGEPATINGFVRSAAFAGRIFRELWRARRVFQTSYLLRDAFVGTTMRASRLIFAFMALVGAVVVAAAQTPTQDAAAGPAIELSSMQRAIIYQSISATQKNQAAPTGFRVSVGGTVPPAVGLAPPPDIVTAIVPQVGVFEVAMIEKQVVIVDPHTRQVAAVIQEGP